MPNHFTENWTLICHTLLLGVLVVIMLSDLRCRIVSNTHVGLVVGLCMICLFAEGTSWAVLGTRLALSALVALPLFILFSARFMGGGDVKLIVAGTLWLSPLEVVNFLIYTALLGGVIGVVVQIRNSLRPQGIRPFKRRQLGVPYAVAISLALIIVLVLRYVEG